MKIQSQARRRIARQQRSRHSARVGSIRESGRSAAEDLRALSRPSTAVEPEASPTDPGGSETSHAGQGSAGKGYGAR